MSHIYVCNPIFYICMRSKLSTRVCCLCRVLCMIIACILQLKCFLLLKLCGQLLSPIPFIQMTSHLCATVRISCHRHRSVLGPRGILTDLCVEGRAQCQVFASIMFLLIFLRQDFSTNLELTDVWLDWQASKPLSPPPQLTVYGLVWILGMQG